MNGSTLYIDYEKMIKVCADDIVTTKKPYICQQLSKKEILNDFLDNLIRHLNRLSMTGKISEKRCELYTKRLTDYTMSIYDK